MELSLKIEILRDLFATDNVSLNNGFLQVDNKQYPVVDDVIILLDPTEYPNSLKEKLNQETNQKNKLSSDFDEGIQFTFGTQWEKYSEIIPSHEEEVKKYFDLVDMNELNNQRVCDLGCGNGRWSYFIQKKCRELILVDFSEAVFVARQNLKDANNTLFFMANIKDLPFRDSFADFIFSLGVLHHLPTPCLDEVRALKKSAPKLLIYLYYALDNRPIHFRFLLSLVTGIRKVCSSIRNSTFRNIFTFVGTIVLYYPLLLIGSVFRWFGLEKYVPLYEFYHKQSFYRIRQDVNDRFFTQIEQRVSKKMINELSDTFSEVIISKKLPYWHFIVKK